MLKDDHRKEVMVIALHTYQQHNVIIIILQKWMESRYPVLADVIKTTKTSTSFHLAEENKEEFPHDDVSIQIIVTCDMSDKHWILLQPISSSLLLQAIKVTEEMSRKYLILSDGDDHDHDGDSDYLPKKRATYLESMFMCVTPESLTPLAAMMYQKFEEICPDYLQEVKRYHDEKKVRRQQYFTATCSVICFLF